MIRVARALALAAAAAVAAGCNPLLSAQSAAPPGRVAQLDEVTGFWGTVKSYRLELSQGVAVAVACHHGGPCDRVVATSDDPAITEIHRAALGTLERSGFASQTASSAVVLVGKAPGTTDVRIRTTSGTRTIRVTVVPPPAPAVTRAAAAP